MSEKSEFTAAYAMAERLLIQMTAIEHPWGAEEGARADIINLAIIDRVWNLWKEKVQARTEK